MTGGLLLTGGPQTKKLAYLVVIFAGVVWLTIGLWVPVKTEWNYAFAALLAAVTTGYVGGKKVGLAGHPAAGVTSQSSDVSGTGSAKDQS